MQTPVLELAYKVRASLMDGEFVYTEWDKCTCGHIYMVAAGRKARPESSNNTLEQHPLYVEAVEEIAKVLGWSREHWQGYTASEFVSNYTVQVAKARVYPGYDRLLPSMMMYKHVNADDALQVVQEVIEKLEDVEAHAMYMHTGELVAA